MRPAALCVLLSTGAMIGATQTPPGSGPVGRIDPAPKTASRYGRPENVPLRDLLAYGDRYQRRMVRTQGVLELGLGSEDYRLREGHGSEELLLLAAVEGSDVRMLLGKPVELTGVVRLLRPKQYIKGVDLDAIEDPELPLLPAPDSRLPRVSLSFLSIFDATPLTHPGEESGGTFRLDPSTRGRSLRVVGQFRGANLFGDLPDLSGRDADAFVLKQGDASVWVIGKAAAGKGFHLNPLLRGDTRFWLEVEGRLEPCAEQTCLRAHHIAMATRPVPASR